MPAQAPTLFKEPGATASPHEARPADPAASPAVIPSGHFDAVAAAKRVSVTAVMGYCAGMAIRRVTKDAAYVVGIGFCSLQLLQYYGFVTIHWNRFAAFWTQTLDVDGDGEVTWNDLKIVCKRGIRFFASGVPDAAGFTTGLLLGFRAAA